RVERAAEVGGSARYAGFLWTVPTDAAMDEVNPSGDPGLRRTLVGGFAEAMAWVRSLDVPAEDEVAVIRYGRGRRIDTALYLRSCERLLREQGGEVLVG